MGFGPPPSGRGRVAREECELEALIAGVEQLPEALRAPVRNNGGGHANHGLFWTVLSASGGTPDDELGAAIDRDLGGFYDRAVGSD